MLLPTTWFYCESSYFREYLGLLYHNYKKGNEEAKYFQLAAFLIKFHLPQQEIADDQCFFLPNLLACLYSHQQSLCSYISGKVH